MKEKLSENQPPFTMHLRGAEQIAKVFGVHIRTVRKWHNAGAPIIILGRCFQASYFDIWTWLKNRKIENHDEND